MSRQRHRFAPPAAAALFAVVATVLAIAGCSDEEKITDERLPPPRAPETVVGVITGTDDPAMQIVWSPGAEKAVAGYHVYRRQGDAEFERLTDMHVTGEPLGPGGASGAPALAFTDTTFDAASSVEQSYVVTTVSASGQESDHSPVVGCVPDTIDLDDAVTGLSPDGAAGVGVTPVLTWTPRADAAAYLVYVREIVGQDSGRVVWLHLYTGDAAELSPGDAPGVSFVDELASGLRVSTLYAWGLWAVSETRCGFARGEAYFQTVNTGVVRTLVSGYVPAGDHTVVWDQLDDGGQPAAAGVYLARLTSFDAAVDLAAGFEIAPGRAVSPGPRDPRPDRLQAEYLIATDSPAYGLGAPVEVLFALPDAGRTRVTIERPSLAPDFALLDTNPNSATYNEPVSPRQFLEQVSAWYFGHAT
jgi:hypothetical protein